MGEEEWAQQRQSCCSILGKLPSAPEGHCSQWQRPAGWTGVRGAVVFVASYEGRKVGICRDCENHLSESEGRFLASEQVLSLSRILVPEFVFQVL